MFKNMGGNIPGGNFLGGNFPCGNFPGESLLGGNFLGGNFPGESLLGGNFPGGRFPDTLTKIIKSLIEQISTDKNKFLNKLELTNVLPIFKKSKLSIAFLENSILTNWEFHE